MNRFTFKYPRAVLTNLNDMGEKEKIVYVGKDKYDHILTLQGTEKFFQVSPINVDATHGMDVELEDGYYFLVAHYHNFHLGKINPAFFIIPNDRSLSNKGLEGAYSHHNRMKLTTRDNKESSYFNFHKGGYNSDASEGCWTMPPSLFHNFRRAFNDMAVIEVLKASYDPSFKKQAFDFLNEVATKTKTKRRGL